MIEAGVASLPGSTALDGGVNFAVCAQDAARVELCLFDVTGREEVVR